MRRMSREQQVRRTEGMQPWKRALVYEHGLKAVLEAQDANPNTPDHPPVITAWLEERRAKRQDAMLRECAGHTAAIANRVEAARQARVQAVIEASEKTTQVSNSEEDAVTHFAPKTPASIVAPIAADGCADAEGDPPPMQWDAPSAPPVGAWPHAAPGDPHAPLRARALASILAPPGPLMQHLTALAREREPARRLTLWQRLVSLFRKPRRSIP
jgi:hypothetical protein